MISLIDAQLAEHEQLFRRFYPLDDENTRNKDISKLKLLSKQKVHITFVGYSFPNRNKKYNVHILKEKNFFKTLIRSEGTSIGAVPVLIRFPRQQ